jgi:hypothetical protein
LAFYWLNLLGQGIVVPFESGSIRRIAGVGLLTMLCMVTATQRCRSLDRLSPNSPNTDRAIEFGDVPSFARLENLHDLNINET